MEIDTLGSFVGAALILWAFGAQQFGKMNTEGLLYSVLNIFGGAVLAAVAAYNALWGYVILNSVWALVAIRTAAKALRTTRARTSAAP